MFRNALIYSLLVFSVTCSCYDLNGQDKQDSNLRTIKIKPVPLAGFKYSDIGNPAIPGTVNILSDGIDMTAGGADIWGIKDEFNFVYVERNGDFDMVTRIESLTAPHQYTKAGLMAREELTADSRHIYFQVFPDNRPRNKNNGGYEYQYRPAKGMEMKAIYPAGSVGTPDFPVAYPETWVRLQRIKNDFIGYYSADGKTWKIYTTFTLELPSKLYLGLAVTSHNAKEAASAKFRNIGEPVH